MTSAGDIIKAGIECLRSIRSRQLRVHCLTNTVVQKFMADGLAGIGAHPSMTSSIDEVAAFVAKTDVLVVNLGTLDPARRDASRVAVAEAVRLGKPWVLDPVHCNLSETRLTFARELLEAFPAVVRGNRAEMAALGSAPSDTVKVTTGPEDRVAGVGEVLVIENGHPWMAAVTGTGCMAGAVLAAFVAVAPEKVSVAAAASLLAIGVAAEEAAKWSRGPGTFEPALLDALASLDGEQLTAHAKIRIEHA